MMGKSRPSAPPVPDPAATARAQGGVNREAAIASARLSQIEEVTPFGTAKYEPTGTTFDVPGGDPIEQYRRTITLDPQDQATLDIERDIAQRLLGTGREQLERVSESFADPFSFEGLPGAPVIDDAARQKVEDALYRRSTSRLDPQFETGQRRLETQLANQGFARGSEGWSRALEDFTRGRTDAYQQAIDASVAGAGAEQGRLYGLGASARERAIQERILERSQPIQELQALTGTAPGMNLPQFAPIPMQSVAPADITGPTALAYQGNMNVYNQQMGAANAFQGGLFGLGAAGLQGYMGRPV